MKSLTTLLLVYMRNRASRRNFLALLRFLIVLVVLVAVCSVVFHVLMEREGREYSWITGIYWTLTVMSTLGFGDIVFESDLGKAFSAVVLLTGLIFLLVLLPFTFIEFFYQPWMEAQKAASVRTRLPDDVRRHVLMTNYGPVGRALVQRLKQHDYPYAVICANVAEAHELHSEDLPVIVGDLHDPETYRKARVDTAALVAATGDEVVNTSVAIAVREVSKSVPIVALARRSSAGSILQLAGCNRVLEFGQMMGRALARRARGGVTVAHVVGRFDDLLIAEANAADTPFVGKTLSESGIRDAANVNVVGIWERGVFEIAQPDSPVEANDVLLLAGSQQQLDDFEAHCRQTKRSAEHVVIVGGGRVGRAVTGMLDELGIKWTLVESDEARVRHLGNCIVGDATEPKVLIEAGLATASTVIITPHNDELNIYLAIFCRKARPDIQIICRSSVDRSVDTMHRVGCDFVMSYASMGANAIFNLLKSSDVLLVAEGLNVIQLPVPESLAENTIAESRIREVTGCSVIAVCRDGKSSINPDPATQLQPGAEIVIIGTAEAEKTFLEKFA